MGDTDIDGLYATTIAEEFERGELKLMNVKKGSEPRCRVCESKNKRSLALVTCKSTNENGDVWLHSREGEKFRIRSAGLKQCRRSQCNAVFYGEVLFGTRC